MRYYIIAGEASGDMHAANLVKAILRQDPQAQFKGIGGDQMRTAGVHLSRHYRDTAYMGFVEVFMHLRAILGHIQFCKKDIADWHPNVVILVDYPGFNLRIAPFAKHLGCKVCYYISPQLWAWKSGRVEIIRKYVDKMLVILPFEEAFYQQHQYPVTFVGHPLLDAIDAYQADPDFLVRNNLKAKPYIALLPGSRKQEIAVKLPVMLSMVPHFPEYDFVVACAPGQEMSYYRQFARNKNVYFISGATYDILKHAHSALVTSGTATLETALFRVPQIVCYKGNPISYWIAKRLVHIKYISLVNLIADKSIVPELIQHDFNKITLLKHMQQTLNNVHYRTEIQRAYTILHDQLGGSGASARAAREIHEWMMTA